MHYIQVLVERAAISQALWYICDMPLTPFVRVRVPLQNKSVIGLVLSSQKDNPLPSVKNWKSIEAVLDQNPLLSMEQWNLAKWLSRTQITPLMPVIQAMLPKALKPSSTSTDAVKEEWIERTELEEENFKLTKKQEEILHASWPMQAAAARKTHSAAIIRRLIDYGLLRLIKKDKSYSLLPAVQKSSWPVLHPSQKDALDFMQENAGPVFLLHGVTGSGKTEVFFHLMKEQIDKGKQVLLLVPEIGLTPQMISRTASRFDCPIYLYTSSLSDSERYSQYQAVLKGGPFIVIATRSGVFLPFDNLGLIIMDEEHDQSYRQQSLPHYHARDLAIHRAALFDAKVILASATPSLESYARAWRHVYQLVRMPERISGHFPRVRLLDMKSNQSLQGLSHVLIGRIEETLKKGEKVMLLLNRRGYQPTIQCTACHHVMICEDCGIPLSYHKKENALVCHICSRRYPVPKVCPSCGSERLSFTGAGTEHIEETLHQLFPLAHIVRMDRDTTSRKGAHQKLLSEFEESGDILLGTQMISKGLDFEKVTLVGILSADAALARSDYRTAESAYAMFEQASGRAGRGRYKGEVLIQAYNPDHYALQALLCHDYEAFFKREMAYRHLGAYPPYTYLATIIFTHADSMTCYLRAEQARDWLADHQAMVLGPLEITMRKKKIRNRLLVKSKNLDELRALLEALQVWDGKNKSPVSLEIDLNPMALEE